MGMHAHRHRGLRMYSRKGIIPFRLELDPNPAISKGLITLLSFVYVMVLFDKDHLELTFHCQL
jgi:hypothetical protein